MSKKLTILKLKKITKDFPGVRALDNVSIELKAGEIHALVGENGAGKSTLGKIIAGIILKDKGTIYIEDKEIRKNSPHIAHSLGVSIVLQELYIIPSLTIAQYLFLANEPLGAHMMVKKKEVINRSRELLDDLEINIDTNTKLSDLSIGQQQMIAVARALAFNPKILILDEPTSSLTTFEVQKLFGILRKLKSKGVGIIYISHRLEEVFEIADKVTVLRDGKLINTVEVSKAKIDSIISMMVGRDISEMYPKEVSEIGKEILSLSSVFRKGVCKNINLVVREGEIIGLYGLIGAGRTELARIVFGLDHYDTGRIKVFNKEITKKNSPFNSVAMGIGLLPEDRKEQGLCMVLPIKQNVIRASLKNLFPKWFIRPSKENKITRKYISELNIATDSTDKQVVFLSGGNQQKVVLAHWMCANSRLLILDEPTRGIDVGAKVEVYKLMNNLAEAGVGILLISSDLPEIMGMSDRIYVMSRGEMKSTFSGGRNNQDEILSYAIGTIKGKNNGVKDEIL